MRFRLPGPAWFLLGAMLLLGCGSDDHGVSYPFQRSPGLFQSDTVVSAHPFCAKEGSAGAQQSCIETRKYKLSWRRPDDTVNLKGYRIYLDTARDDMKWGSLQGLPEKASIILERIPARDSVIFSFLPGERKDSPDTLKANEERVVRIDSVDRTDLATGALMFALVPVYGGGITAGQPQYTYFMTTDRQPPDPFHPDFRPLPRGVTIAWERPTDRVSFFDPSRDTGIIAGYELEIGMDKTITDKRRAAFQPKLKSYRVSGADSTTAAKDSVLLTEKGGLPNRVRFFLPDGRRSAKHVRPDSTDSIYVEIGNLFPQDSLTFEVWAVDSAGNPNDSAMEKISLRTTDTTQPAKPRLGYDSLQRNGFRIFWRASRDSVPAAGGGLQEAGPANANIKGYHLSRIRVRDPGERTTSLDRLDTLIQDSLIAAKDTFRVEARFLPPGATFHLSLYAEDSSGYLSQVDTLNVTTPKVAFAGPDSALACPPGFVPVPRDTFTLGSAAGGGPDENPSRNVDMASFCIEPYEHRDSSGQRFVSNVTWEQADAICRSIDSTGYDTRLCSEAEWERACEGPVAGDGALLHGIQSEGKDPSILQTSCNQATNDSAMAMTYALRNSVCLTTEGIYDMAGNLSEWVRDTYAPRAYDSLPKGNPLAMEHGSFLADKGGASLHSIRGGNFLKPANAQTAVVQSFARCSNRDYPEQVRPVSRPECRSDSIRKLVVIYGPGLENHRCYELDEEFRNVPYSELVPSQKYEDTILAFRKGVPDPDPIHFDRDSLFKGRKPLSARFTGPVLAEVTFERTQSLPGQGADSAYKDTLDATEFRDTTQAGLEKIFRREASNPGWAVRKVDGKYAIKYIYGYAELGSKPALPFYSSRAIGFRCCSKAVETAPPPDSAVAGK